jgi:hypothetical protein
MLQCKGQVIPVIEHSALKAYRGNGNNNKSFHFQENTCYLYQLFETGLFKSYTSNLDDPKRNRLSFYMDLLHKTSTTGVFKF